MYLHDQDKAGCHHQLFLVVRGMFKRIPRRNCQLLSIQRNLETSAYCSKPAVRLLDKTVHRSDHSQMPLCFHGLLGEARRASW